MNIRQTAPDADAAPERLDRAATVAETDERRTKPPAPALPRQRAEKRSARRR
jgi:hypothetical protein